MNLIIESILFGFAFYSLFFVVIKIFTKEKYPILDKVDDSAVTVIKFASILFFLHLIYNLLKTTIFNETQYDNYGIINWMFGQYWFGFWIYPISYFGLIQLLWFKKFKASLLFRIFISLAILFALFIERIIIFLTSFERDIVPSSWVYYKVGYSSNFILNLFIQISIFGISVGITFFLKRKLQK